MKTLKLALDWTPNINHIGFFVAQEKGFYRALQIDLQITNPLEDNYAVTPAKKVELGLSDFALCPTESVISYRTKERPFDMIAIAAILQDDLSAITVKSNSGINSPKDLDGKIYSSYKARYEDGIVKEMIKNDGGKGDLQIVYPEKLGIWNTILKDEADATWIFLNWEGVEADASGYALNYFKMNDYQIPYSYSPVIACNASRMEQNLWEYQAFLSATKKGYLYCQENPDEAVSILTRFVPQYDQHINLSDALSMTAPSFGNAENWGVIHEENIQNFLSWIQEKGLEEHPITLEEIATNKCLV
jgi:ABC-type nitrate/sulfonate/bicarbonate transport system substrate-binding protein